MPVRRKACAAACAQTTRFLRGIWSGSGGEGGREDNAEERTWTGGIRPATAQGAGRGSCGVCERARVRARIWCVRGGRVRVRVPACTRERSHSGPLLGVVRFVGRGHFLSEEIFLSSNLRILRRHGTGTSISRATAGRPRYLI